MNETVQNLVNAIAAGNAIETEQAFGAAMAERLSAKLEDMRQNVAQSMFAPQETVAEEFSEEADLAMIEENFTEEFDSDEIYLSEEELSDITEKYEGFNKLQGELKAKGAKNPAGLAAWIGRRKYGKAKFQKAAANDRKLG